MPGDAHLVCLQLGGSELVQRVVVGRAMRRIRRLSGGGRERVHLLLDTPSGYAFLPALPAGVDVCGIGDAIDEDRLPEISREVRDLSHQLVGDAGGHVFPTYRAIPLGELNLLSLSQYLFRYRLLACAIRQLAQDRACASISIFGTSPELLDLLEVELPPETPSSVWSPRSLHIPWRLVRRSEWWLARMRGLLRDVGRHGTPESVPDMGELPAAIHTLFVAESEPMRKMFRVVRSHLDPEVAGGASLTVLYDEESGLERFDDDDWRLHLARERIEHRTRAGNRFDPGGGGLPASGSAPEGEPDLVTRVARSPFFRFWVENRRHDRFESQARLIELANEILEAARPRIVVVGNDRDWPGQIFVRVARARGIPTLVVQDGVVADPMEWSWAVADHVAANGPYLGHLLESYGYASARWTATGQPRYDPLHGLDVEGVRAAVRGRIGIPPDARLVLYPTQPEHSADYTTTALEAILAVPGVHVAVRPHHSESPEHYERLIQALSGELHLCGPEYDILGLIAASDVVVVQYSTVALEAAALGRPVIGWDFLGDLPRPHMEAASRVRATTPDQLTSALARALGPPLPSDDSPDAESPDSPTLHGFTGPLDGAAGERVAAVILRMADEARRPVERPAAAEVEPETESYLEVSGER